MTFKVLREIKEVNFKLNEVYHIFTTFENGNVSLIKCSKSGKTLSISNKNNIRGIKQFDLLKLLQLNWIERMIT